MKKGEKMTIEEKIQNLSHEDLKVKFLSLYKQYNQMAKDKSIKLPEKTKAQIDLIDFTNHKIKRRQQYLHKTYTKNPTALNFLLSEMLKNNDENLQEYFTNLNKQLENEAQRNNDMPLSNIY